MDIKRLKCVSYVRVCVINHGNDAWSSARVRRRGVSRKEGLSTWRMSVYV